MTCSRVCHEPEDYIVPFDRVECECIPVWIVHSRVVPESGWLLGEDFTLADISVASMFRSLAYVGREPDAGAYPLTAAWYDRVRERPAWQVIAEKEAYRPARAQ